MDFETIGKKKLEIEKLSSHPPSFKALQTRWVDETMLESKKRITKDKARLETKGQTHI